MSTTTGHCTCSEDQKEFSEIANIIDLYRDKEGSLIQILHAAQEIYGYLPLKLQEFIAVSMGIPVSEVTGVASFYSFFFDEAAGRHTIVSCSGRPVT
jgi:NADH:ubiquinone oxidoreductase subunit E